MGIAGALIAFLFAPPLMLGLLALLFGDVMLEYLDKKEEKSL